MLTFVMVFVMVFVLLCVDAICSVAVECHGLVRTMVVWFC